MPDDQTRMTGRLPGGAHGAEAGRLSLLAVRYAVQGLRPDLAATVLTTALAEMAMTIPADRRPQYVEAFGNLMRKCWLAAEDSANGR